MPDAETSDLMDKIVNLSKRRGFVFPSAEIYGGFRSTYDYGPIGVLLLRNVKDAWWRSMVQLRHDVVGLDAAILSPPQIWEASGHLANFTDPLVDCKVCQERFRLDKLDDPHTCPNCGSKDSFTEARQFNLMFKTHAGPLASNTCGGPRMAASISTTSSRCCTIVRTQASRTLRSISEPSGP